MATLQASSLLCSSGSNRGISMTTINIPKLRTSNLSLPKLPILRDIVQELVLKSGHNTAKNTTKNFKTPDTNVSDDPMVMAKLDAIMEAIADRIEMHTNICEQRNNWNNLLLTSINAITLAAATIAGIAATSAVGSPVLGLNLCSSLMYLAASGMLIIMNKIQPSQLAEEQRNATRLFKQLLCEIQTSIAIGCPTMSGVEEAMEKVLALDRAFPLPLLGAMLEKFPSAMEPAVWWAPQRRRQENGLGGGRNGNGWSGKLEEDMREIVGVLGKNDKADYLRLGQKALKINKVLAISGPLLTGLAAVGSAFVGPNCHGSWAAVLGVAAGALASVVNTMEHGGQVGMVVELYRGNAGFFRLMEETIESNLKEDNVERRENGELFEMKVALQLGRSLPELRDLAAKGQDSEEFGSKLF